MDIIHLEPQKEEIVMKVQTYYLMKGMEGNADSNKDRNITNKEMHNYLQDKVSQKALEIYSREQLPAFTGSPEKILWRY